MRAAALVYALPVATLAITLSELTRIPFGSVSAHLSAWAEIAGGAVHQLVGPAVAVGLVAAALAWRDASERAPAFRYAVAALGGLLLSAVAHATLADPVRVHALAIAASVCLGLGFAALLAGAGGRALPVAVVVLACVLARSHYQVLVGLYPSVHAWVVRVAFLALTLGAARTFEALDRPRVVGSAALLAGALAVSLAVVAPTPVEASPAVLAYTELGRGASVEQALREQGALLHPTEVPGERPLAPDPDAVARFERHGGLPPLERSVADLDVLLVLIEATRFDRTSLADTPAADADPTPNLRRLAARSQVFERAYAPSNGTFASISSLVSMTPSSYAAVDVRPRFWRGRLRDEARTAAEVMREAGRRTFYVGHDHRGTFSHTIVGVTQGFDDVTLVPQERGEPADADADARIADEARRAWRGGAGPRFGMVFFVSPHDDYQVHDPDAPAETELDRYDQELRYADAQLGRLLEAIDLERTVVVVAGDHGEAFGEHEHRHHLTSLHDEQIHVPLVVHVPGMLAARHRAPTSVRYVLPWLLLRGRPGERAHAREILASDIGPMLRATDGAVLSEMIGQRRQEAALIFDDVTMIVDVFSRVTRIYLTDQDPEQRDDVAESRPDLRERALDLSLAYRAARFDGQRFRFTR